MKQTAFDSGEDRSVETLIFGEDSRTSIALVELKQVTVKATRKQHFNQPKENKEHMGRYSYSQPSSSECNGYLVDEESSHRLYDNIFPEDSLKEIGKKAKTVCGMIISVNL
ncbi:PREDICTED: uncharacterized protein LOC109132653 [Camelina sativa]|uniref:Uncharacterized protein LOC109132653 n=1 Tax=Camelina sativa TaxID=90675 RepID=A0ABM1RM40_CAMSA|nr:PREDICTED: uncharacterized protein LOC109132653 [Camelina sativa]